MVESKLGQPGAQIRAWERRGGSYSMPASYQEPLQAILIDMSNWEKTMRRFYQLFRHLVLANELCRSEVWVLNLQTY
jgi:hypothetical protein